MESEEIPEKRKSKPYWLLIFFVPLTILLFVAWLNKGEEACPPEAHPLMMYAGSHNLHYRMTLQQQLDQSTPTWCVFLWPKGEHWYSEGSFGTAGAPYHPLWRSCDGSLAKAVAALLVDHVKSPTGDYTYVPSKTLIECTH